jgi:uncharacterized membrane protein YdjX (TVP38/TMEM64 family)
LLLKNGLWLFSGIAILPAFILPVSPLLALAGIWGETHGAFYAALLSSLALTLNCCWTYWLASWCGPKFLDYIYFFFRKKKFSNIEKPKKTLWQWALILRLTPGIPFIFGNYLLGSFKMPFITYLMISCSDFICQCIWLHLCCVGTCKWRLQSFEWGRCDINSNIFGWKIFNFSEKNAG